MHTMGPARNVFILLGSTQAVDARVEGSALGTSVFGIVGLNEVRELLFRLCAWCMCVHVCARRHCLWGRPAAAILQVTF